MASDTVASELLLSEAISAFSSTAAASMSTLTWSTTLSSVSDNEKACSSVPSLIMNHEPPRQSKRRHTIGRVFTEDDERSPREPEAADKDDGILEVDGCHSDDIRAVSIRIRIAGGEAAKKAVGVEMTTVLELTRALSANIDARPRCVSPLPSPQVDCDYSSVVKKSNCKYPTDFLPCNRSRPVALEGRKRVVSLIKRKLLPRERKMWLAVALHPWVPTW